jgi:sulfhydrogenase subunit alpha
VEGRRPRRVSSGGKGPASGRTQGSVPATVPPPTLKCMDTNSYIAFLVVSALLVIVYAVEEALRITESYERPAMPSVEVPPRAGIGYGATEAPRGLLYHRYELDAAGRILSADIVPPTSQNQSAIESDVTQVVRAHQHLDDHALQSLCEQTIRNYDPCISCSAHFLDFTRDAT